MDQINAAMMGYEKPQCKSLVASYWFWQKSQCSKMVYVDELHWLNESKSLYRQTIIGTGFGGYW